MDEMAPVMEIRHEDKEVRAGLRRKYLRQRLGRIDTSQRDPRRDLTVVTNGRNLRRQEVVEEVEDGDDSDDEQEAAKKARQGTKNRQKDGDSDDDDDEHEHKQPQPQPQPVATLALPSPETPSPTVQSFPPLQLAPSTSKTSLALPSPTSPASPPTPTFPVLPPPPPPVITMPPTTVVMTSTVIATPKASGNAPVVNNPQIEPPPPTTTSTSISVMTTQPLPSLVSSISVSSQPRKGVGNPETSSFPTSSPTSTETSTLTTPFAFEKGTPSPTVSLNDVKYGNDGGRDRDDGPPPRGLDPGAEHALISAGSIGELLEAWGS